MDTPESSAVSTRLQRIAELAKKGPTMAFTSLGHHIDVAMLREAYRRTRKDGAVGVDGQTAEAYAANLEQNLQELHERLKSGGYQAPPVRRQYIPKDDGRRMRPIGIPTFEDKVLQRAVVMVLEAVYEQDFLACSYGFRPGRSAHQALNALWEGMMRMGGGWVLDVDLRDFFGSLRHEDLRAILDQRVRDGVLRRVIGKWLKAGVMEDGQHWRPEGGTPQGGVISPLLANVYLHEVLDKWFEQQVKPRLQGASLLVRYADDFVIVCAKESDARRVMEVLPKRLGRYGLAINAEKTRLVEFRPGTPRRGNGEGGNGAGRSFDLLGFTHFWGRSRKGRWVVMRKTAKGRFRRTLGRIGQWLRHHLHDEVQEQQRMLSRMLKGHDGYYGITGNAASLGRLRREVEGIWRRWLARRSDSQTMTWDIFRRLLKRYPLPPARVVHSVYRHAANALS